MSPDPIPAAPTPWTREQAAAIHGENQLVVYPDEYLVYALLQPDHPSLPPIRRRLPRLALNRVADDIAQVRRQWHDPNDEVA
jgi:hypothetical protein